MSIICVDFVHRCRSTRHPVDSRHNALERAVLACRTIEELDALIASWRKPIGRANG